jgi:hypothetical protein
MTNADEAQPQKEQNRNYNNGPTPGQQFSPPEGQPDEARTPARIARIRKLNDHLRTTNRGGIVLITDGLRRSSPLHLPRANLFQPALQRVRAPSAP